MISVVQDLVSPDDFQEDYCRAIFEAAKEILSEGGVIDPLSIRARAGRTGTNLPIDSLMQSLEVVPTAVNCEDYAHRVAEDARTRKIKDLATQIQLDGFSSPDELVAVLQQGLQSLSAGQTGRKKGFSLISARDLQKADIPPVRFLVEELLPEGASLIVAAPKIGKSWMVLDMGMSIAAGTKFLGKDTYRCGVLYLALEDSNGRLQSRMNKILRGAPAPNGFYFLTEAPNMDNGLLDQLGYTLDNNPEIKLVIVDTLQKIRGRPLPREKDYDADYRFMGTLKAFGDKRGVSILCVHHKRKMDDEDPFNTVSGTNGILGAVDTAWVIEKGRKDQNATLHITGRDVAQAELVIGFDKDRSWKWRTIGTADQINEQNARLEYENSPVVQTVRQLLKESKDGQWSGTATELMNEGKRICKHPIAVTPQKLGYSIKKLDPMFQQYESIVHETTPNGNAGNKHHFYSLIPDWVLEADQQEILPL